MACIAKRRGRLVIDFYDQTGARRWKTLPKGTTKKQANEILGQMERSLRLGVYSPAKNLPTFEMVADSWLQAKQQDIRGSTYGQYSGHLENHLKPFFGHLKINAVNYDSIVKFKAKAVSSGVKIPTLKKIMVNLGAILTFAVRLRYIEFNPARDVEKPKGQSLHDENKEMNVLKPDDIQSLLKAAACHKDRVFFLTAVLTGGAPG